MNIAAATPAEILAVVKWWARVRGWCRGAYWPASQPWIVDVGVSTVTIWQGTEQGCRPRFEVSPAIALAWALLVESDAAPVYTGKCKATQPDPNGFPTTYQCRRGAVPKWIGIVGTSPTWWTRDGATECPACGGTTLVVTPAAVLLLDAVENVDAREYLAAHADQLLAVGNPLGELIAWALRLWTGEPMERVPNSYADDGHAQVGHPHTADAVRWLDWLTWGNWFMERHRERERVAAVLSSDYLRTAIDWNDPPSVGTRSAYERAARHLAPRVTSVDITTDRTAHEITLTYTGTATVAEVEDAIEPVRLAAHWVTVVHAIDRTYADSLPLLAEPTFGGAGDVISVTAGEHTYSVTTERPMTASEIAAAFNEQGGPATFVSADDGRAMSMGFHETSSASYITAELRELPIFIPEPETPRHQPHARHIGDRLGRRLGVRR